MFFLAVVALLLPSPQNPPATDDLVQSIEQQRGGRHWIDQATAPPKSPEDSLKCFQIEPGSRIELVAAEPLVFDPVAMEFDAAGNLFVAEYSDYPVGPADPQAPRLSRIVRLVDSNHDGRFDERTIVADHLAFCHSLMPLMNGLLACTDTEILFLKDTNADGIADVREVWFDGFTPAHPQMQIGCPRWGFDNWIYLTYGPGNVRCRRPGFETQEPTPLSGLDFRFHPLSMKFESITGLGQFGNTIDNDGRRYFSTNRNPIMTDVLSRATMARNPFFGISIGHTDVGPGGEMTRVFPLVAMKSNWLSHAGTHTSACGVTAYRGDLFDESFQHSVFACEPVGHLVTRSIIQPDGSTVTSVRARPEADFLASTDTWFRPASLSTGPDGALYLADMYRLWVEHPKFVPEDVAAKMDWRAGDDRGRIWRIVPEETPATRPLPAVSTSSDLVNLLSDRSSWRRILGQRLLVEQQSIEAVPAVQILLNNTSASAHARLHALWTLDGLGQLTTSNLGTALNDAAPSVRRSATRIATESLSAKELTKSHSVQNQLAQLCLDESAEVRLEAIVAAGIHPGKETGQLLARALLLSPEDPWIRAAVLSSAATCSGDLLQHLIPEWTIQQTAQEDIVHHLTQIVAARGDLAEVQQAMTLLASQPGSPTSWQTSMLVGFAHGLPTTRNPELPKSLAALLDTPPAPLAEQVVVLRSLMMAAAQTSIDSDKPETERLAAIRLLPFQSGNSLAMAVVELLQSRQPVSCQLAALEAVRQSGRADLALVTLDQWSTLNPQVRSQVLDLLLIRQETILQLLQKMSSGHVSASVVSIDQRLRLLQSTDEQIRILAASLFGGTVSADRKLVAEQYAAALEMKATVAEGARVFQKSCSKCHRIDGVGHQVGPDISDTRNRARDALLYDMLDPNRRVDPQFTEYVVQTADGRTFAGLLVSETANSVVLRQPEAILQTIERKDIEEMRSTNRSLMPEGIEKDVSVQQMADLLEFLKER